jgi:membrane protein required for colicin V production
MLDLAFLAFILIFVATAFFRGFIKEIFALLSWILALLLSYFLAPYVSELIEKYSRNALVSDIIARSLIFVIVFFVCTISTSGLRDALKEKMPKAFDRSLGVFYGLVKTILVFGFIVSLAFNLYGFLLNKKIEESSAELPIWYKEAKSHDILKFSAELLDPTVKLYFDAASKNFEHVIPKSKNLDEKIDEVIDQKNSKKVFEENSAELNKASEDSGYNKKDLEKMNR